MSTLFTFGCSFSEEFNVLLPRTSPNTRVDYIEQYFDGVAPDSWPTMLSKKLGLDIKNYSGNGGYKDIINNFGEGNCNQSILNNIAYYCNEFKKGDIVIVEWTYIERFKWANEGGRSMISVYPAFVPGTGIPDYPDYIDNNTAENIFVNRTNPLWINELFIQQKLLNQLAINTGFDIFYWTVDSNIVKYKNNEIKNDKKYLLSDILGDKDYMGLFNNNGAKTIIEETNQKVRDWHYGVTGHQVQCDLFYNYIIKNI